MKKLIFETESKEMVIINLNKFSRIVISENKEKGRGIYFYNNVFDNFAEDDAVIGFIGSSSDCLDFGDVPLFYYRVPDWLFLSIKALIMES